MLTGFVPNFQPHADGAARLAHEQRLCGVRRLVCAHRGRRRAHRRFDGVCDCARDSASSRPKTSVEPTATCLQVYTASEDRRAGFRFCTTVHVRR